MGCFFFFYFKCNSLLSVKPDVTFAQGIMIFWNITNDSVSGQGMRRLIWAFAVRTCAKTRFSMVRSILLFVSMGLYSKSDKRLNNVYIINDQTLILLATGMILTFGLAPSEDSDQPAHPRRLIRIFTGRILDRQECKVSSCGQRGLWSDCVGVQPDLIFRLMHTSGRTFTHVGARIIIFIALWIYSRGRDKLSGCVTPLLIDWLCWGLTTHQPLWVILCRLPEKGRKEIEEIVEEMKERDREDRGTWIRVKKQKK